MAEVVVTTFAPIYVIFDFFSDIRATIVEVAMFFKPVLSTESAFLS